MPEKLGFVGIGIMPLRCPAVCWPPAMTGGLPTQT